MQDVHWPSGAIGYFPSYTLGALIAAQQWVAIEKAQPSVRDDFRNGRFVGVNDWRRDNIWSQASRWSTPDLLERATGEKLNAKHFAEHLQRRYLA
jgi:carboxypeptidase Taq